MIARLGIRDPRLEAFLAAIPRHWDVARFGDVAETRLGKMLSTKTRPTTRSKPYLRNQNIQWGHFDLTSVLRIDLDESELDRYRIWPGDLLVCEGGEVGRAAIWKGELSECYYQKALHRVRSGPRVTSNYLYWLLVLYASRHYFSTYVTGTTIDHLPQEALRDLPIPIPPLDEQRRIVGAIEEQFSRIDAAERSLSSAELRLARAVDLIAAPCVAPIDAEGWRVVKLGEVADVRSGIQKQPKRRPVTAAARPYLRVANVLRGRLDLSDVQQMELFAGELDTFRLMVGDLLVVEGNGSRNEIGRGALWNGEMAECVHQNHIIRVRPNPRVLLPSFLEVLWNTRATARKVANLASSTSGLYVLNAAKVRSFELALPPLDEQMRLVTDVQEQRARAARLQAAIATAVQRSHAVRRGVLAAPFTGTLPLAGEWHQDTSVSITVLEGAPA